MKSRTNHEVRRSARRAIGLLALTAAFAGSCSNTPLPDPGSEDRANNGVSTMRVTITGATNRGLPETPLAFDATHEFTVKVEALGRDGNPVPTFNGTAQIAVTPGVMTNISGPNVTGRLVRLSAGVAEGIVVRFVRAYGETRISAEEQGYDLRTEPGNPSCADGMDNDMDGRVDYPADYGCAAPNDDSERGGSYAQGVSNAIFIGTPTVDDVQGSGGTSPLLNERVNITRGSLVVTRISVSGFWVTDTARVFCPAEGGGMRRCANSLFSFNFRLPEGMRPCDRLARLSGTVQEFVSTTQMAQPSWNIPPEGLFTDRSGTCPIPEAVVLRPTAMGEMPSSAPALEVLDMSDMSERLEPLENAIVRLQNVVLSQNVGPARASCDMAAGTCTFGPGRSNCDLRGDRGDGVVNFDDPLEALCANTCQKTVGCSEWTGWIRFGQMAVDFAQNQPANVQRFIIAPREAISNFDPLNQPAPGVRATVTGTLKQVGPNWIVEPRCTVDLVFDGRGTVLAPNASCVTPRAIGEESG
ncbi:MAG: hypothetical protein JNK05_35550 [Myxococcales bacterium]|nr:hypothetical protein [Myxococcales bacterium]